MITATRAACRANEYEYRIGQATIQKMPLLPTVFALGVQSCEAAKLSAEYDCTTALMRIGDGVVEENPYG